MTTPDQPMLAPSTAINYIDPHGTMTTTERADRLGMPRATYYRWIGKPSIGPFEADKIAIRLGVHPVDIWPAWDEWHPEHDEGLGQTALFVT